MNNIIERLWNQNKMVQIEDLKGSLFQDESAGHTFKIYGIDDAGNTVALSGTPSGVFHRPDNTDVALSCSVSEGVVSATLPSTCYDVPGRGGITVFLTSNSQTMAIYAAVATITRTESGTVAPPVTQNVVDLINAISAAVATIPASYSDLMADIAPTYSTSALYAVGQYAWYDGDLKRCIVPITTAESYTAAHWTSAVLGNDVSDLKSALIYDESAEYRSPVEFISMSSDDFAIVSGSLTTTGKDYTSTTRCRTNYFKIDSGKYYKISLDNPSYHITYAWGYSSASQNAGVAILGHLNGDNTYLFVPQATMTCARVVFRRVDNANITSEDKSAILTALKLYEYTDESLSISGASADAKVVGEKFSDIKSALTEMDNVVYPIFRINQTTDEPSYPIQLGYFSGNVGDDISWNSSGTTYARTVNRLPLDRPTRISIQNSDTYLMRVFACVRGGNTIVYKSDMVNNDILLNPDMNPSGIMIGVNFMRKDSGSLSSSDLETIQSLFRIYYSYGLDNTLTQVDMAANAKTVGDRLHEVEYPMIRKSYSGNDYYPVQLGYFSGNVGDDISWVSTGTTAARTTSRIPLALGARISIQNSDTYLMRVFACVLGGDTIVYKSDLDNNDIILNPDINPSGIMIGVNFVRKDNGSISESDLETIQSLFRIYYSIAESVNRNNKKTEIKMPLELGSLSTPNHYLYDMQSQYDNFYKTMRTPHFLDVRTCDTLTVTSDFDNITAVWYGKDYDYLTSLVITPNQSESIPADVSFARFTVTNDDDADFDHYQDFISVTCSGNAQLLKAIDNYRNSRNTLMCYIVPGQLGRDHSGTSMQSPSELADTTGLLRLPPNYDNEGSPVPLIVYVHGSSDYASKWQNAIRGQVGNDEVITYLVNEGYAVFDCFGHTSTVEPPVPDAKGHTYGSVDCSNCYIAGIRRVMDVYNICTDGIYVTGISSGGITALNLAFNNTIPVLACAPFAPVVSILSRCLGYNGQQRKEWAWAHGFTGDYTVLNGRNGASDTTNAEPAFTTDLFEFLTDNATRIIGYNPMWNGLIGVSLSQLLEWGLEPYTSTRLAAGDRDPDNWVNVYRTCKTPIKIWIANDDHNVPPEIIYNFLTTLKNGQCIGEERRVPDGEGGHYAFTSSETCTRASGVTSLGIAYTDIPIYWMEMVAFFRSF